MVVRRRDNVHKPPMAMLTPKPSVLQGAFADPAVESALRTIGTEREALGALGDALAGPLGTPFADAVERIAALNGRVIVTGVGKSGHIAHKIAATLASTGTPAFFVHPAEANHGDLGMIARDDAVIAVSWSGETSELQGTLAYARRFSIPLVAITSRGDSTLGQAADIVLELPREREACPNNLAPTTSSLMTLALGDALAVALLEKRRFTADDFVVFHPGGQLGAQLTRVREIMHGGDDMPLVPVGTEMMQAVLQISAKGFGCVGVVAEDGRLAGIVTDGDLRRHLSHGLLAERVDDVMSVKPKTISPDMMAVDALNRLDRGAISALLVVEDERPVGIVHFLDLLKLGVV